MSTQSIINAINRLEKEIADLSGKIAAESKIESDNRSRIAQIEKSITKNTSAGALTSKLNDIKRRTAKINSAVKTRADLEKKMADKSKRLATERKKLLNAEAKERDSSQKLLNETINRYNDFFEQMEQEKKKATEDMLNEAMHASPQDSSQTRYDVFISHASEDKDEIAKPLYEKLVQRGITAFYDDDSIVWGDSLRHKIDKGLANSRFAIVILSPNFFKKKWATNELDGLFAIETHEKLILPLWHNVSKDDVAKESPLLVGRKALKTADFTLDEIADVLEKSLGVDADSNTE